MTDYTELVRKLRGTPSRSKRKLLDEAAEAIEEMGILVYHLKDYVQYCSGCMSCDHFEKDCDSTADTVHTGTHCKRWEWG